MTQTMTQQTMNQTYNHVTFIGNLGRDPEMSYTPKGTACTKFSLAVYQGENKPAMWLTIECWKDLAQQCHEKLSKGARIEIEGRLVQDSWEDKTTGHKRSALKVVARTVRVLKRAATAPSSSGFIEGTSDDEDSLGALEDHTF